MKIDRLVSIIMLLLQRERIGAQALADTFEVSPRTIYRDIDSINRAGIPVFSTPGVGGGFAIMDSYKVDNRVFSAADLSAILTGLSSLSAVVRGDGLAGALAKVQSLIPGEMAQDIVRRKSQLQIDGSPWTGSRNLQPYLEIMQKALAEHRLLSFTYTDGHGRRSARTAEPYRLVLKHSQWYWQGYCHAREDFRLFKVSRMADLQMETGVFTPRAAPAPLLAAPEAMAAKEIRIRLRVHQSIMDRVLDVCAPDDITPDGGEHAIAAYPFLENDFYYQSLLGYGDRCEVLAPPYVRAEMKRRIRAMAAVYEA